MHAINFLLQSFACLALGVHCLLRVHVNEQGEPVNVVSPRATYPDAASSESDLVVAKEAGSEAVATNSTEIEEVATNPGGVVSGSALIILYLRAAAYYNNKIDHGWTDVCFIVGALQEECRCRGEEDPGLRYFATEVVANVARSFYDYMVTRTHFIDTVMQRYVPNLENVQVVNLGAGFDGRLYSMETFKDATLFEMDQAATQAEKRHLVDKCNLKPANTAQVMHYLPLNLEGNTGAYSGLNESAYFSPDRPTIFLLEDVAEYVESHALSSSLKKLSDLMQNTPTCYLIVTGFRDEGKAREMLDAEKELLAPMGSYGDFLRPNVFGDVVQFMFPQPPEDVNWFESNGWQEISTEGENIVQEFTAEAQNSGAGMQGLVGLYMNVFRPKHAAVH